MYFTRYNGFKLPRETSCVLTLCLTKVMAFTDFDSLKFNLKCTMLFKFTLKKKKITSMCTVLLLNDFFIMVYNNCMHLWKTDTPIILFWVYYVNFILTYDKDSS